MNRRFTKTLITTIPLRLTHNPEVVGSNPAPATKIKSLTCENGQGFFIAGEFFGRKSLPLRPFPTRKEPSVKDEKADRSPHIIYLEDRLAGEFGGIFSLLRGNHAVSRDTRGNSDPDPRRCSDATPRFESGAFPPGKSPSGSNPDAPGGGPAHPPRRAVGYVGSVVNERREP